MAKYYDAIEELNLKYWARNTKKNYVNLICFLNIWLYRNDILLFKHIPMDGELVSLFIMAHMQKASPCVFQMDVAAILLGCVMPIRPRIPQPAFKAYFGNCVVLPEPVSPAVIRTWLFLISDIISSL